MTSTLPPLIQAFSGSLGSASANVLTYPLDLITSRLQLDSPQTPKRYTGIQGGLRLLLRLLRKKGLLALYEGLATDTAGTMISNFLYFYIYTWARALVVDRKLSFRSKLAQRSSPAYAPSMIEELLLGFVAGVTSRAVSTPLNIITVNIQAQDTQSAEDEVLEEGETEKDAGVSDVVSKIYRSGGLLGFWKGFKTSIILSLNPALTLTLFQLYRTALNLLRYRLGRRGKSNPSPGEAFIGAAVSNAFATLLLYPLILAKIRLQASSATSLSEALSEAYCGGYKPSPSNAKNAAIRNLKTTISPKLGVKMMYQGLQMQVLKGFLNQGATFLFKGRIESAIVAAYMRRHSQ